MHNLLSLILNLAYLFPLSQFLQMHTHLFDLHYQANLHSPNFHIQQMQIPLFLSLYLVLSLALMLYSYEIDFLVCLLFPFLMLLFAHYFREMVHPLPRCFPIPLLLLLTSLVLLFLLLLYSHSIRIFLNMLIFLVTSNLSG